MTAEVVSIVPVQLRPVAVRQPGDLLVTAQKFIARCAALGQRPNTVAARRHDVEQLLGYLLPSGLTIVPAVTAADIENWLLALIHGEGIGQRSAERKRQTACAFFDYAATLGMLAKERNPARAAARPRWVRKPPNVPPLDALLAMLRRAGARDEPLFIRDHAVLWALLDGALRVSGVCDLGLYNETNPPLYSVHPDGTVFYLMKGGSRGECILGDAAMRALGRWLAVRGQFVRPWSGEALFLSERGNRLSRATLHNLVRRHGIAAGIPRLHAHLLRHARARNLIDRAGLAAASAQLGHSRQSITADTYNVLGRETLRDRVRLAPLGE